MEVLTENKIKVKFQAKDFKSAQAVRWCPGCGDHALLGSLHKAMAELDIKPHETVVVSGIGCSSRLPYYMNTYGFHTIHGRGAAIATGVKVANPELNVWLATGDGDCLAIGGNHFIHAVRRNIDLNIILLNNKIYGLTKGQYSPTSDRGFVSKTSPMGTVEDPFRPAELCFGARGKFFARSLDTDLKISTNVLVAAAKHKGASVVEVLQNCVIFNHGIHSQVTDRTTKAENTILLQHGEKMIFGAEKNKGIVLEGFTLKAVTIGESGYTMDDILVHDVTIEDSTLHLKLALMDLEDGLPVALGVIRDVEAATYDDEYEKQMQLAQSRKPGQKFRDFLLSQNNVWEIK